MRQGCSLSQTLFNIPINQWRAQASGGAGSKWHYEGTIADRGVPGPPRLGVSRFTILSRFFVMLVFLFCKLFEHYSQTNFHIIKTKAFKASTLAPFMWQPVGLCV